MFPNQIVRRNPNTPRRVTARAGLYTPATINAAVRLFSSAAKAGYKYMKSGSSSAKPKTKQTARVPKGKGPNKRHRGRGGVGTSGGTISKGTSVKGDKTSMYMKKGVVKTMETSLVTNNNDCVIIGHTTRIPLEEMHMIARAMIKKLFVQDLDYVSNFENAISLGTTGTLNLTYYVDPVGSTLTTTVIPIAIGETFESLANLLYIQFYTIVNAENQVTFNELVLNRTIDAVQLRFARLDLTSMKIHYWCKSDFKMQNRSTNEVDEDTEVVDQIPVYGKSYEGTGNGAILKGSRITPFHPVIGLESTGVIAGSGTGVSVVALKEPPAPKAFTGVKLSGKVKIEPGEVKTSSLSDEWKISFNVWFSELQRPGAGGYLVAKHRISRNGHYRFFALEKMLNIAGESAVVVAYELNSKYGCYVTFKDSTVTQALFS